MKVLLCQFGGIGERNIKDTLCGMGYSVQCLWVKSENYDADKELLQKMITQMKSSTYDFVFSLNFLPIISKVCNVFRTVYISWIYDCPELHMYSPAVYNPVNRLFFFDRSQYEHFQRYNPGNVFYQHLVTNPMKDEDINAITKQEHNRFDNDVCFIGSLYNEKNRRFQEIETLPEYWKGYIRGIAEAQLNVYGYNFIEDSLTDYAVNELSRLLHYELIDDYERIDREIISDMYIGMLVSSMDRIRTINSLSKDYDVVLYTDCDISMINGAHLKGTVDSDIEMPKLLHCSKININVTMKTMRTGIPIRVFDTLGVKGFMLTNYQAEIYDLFEPGVDLVVYEDMNDLNEKVAYYLEHEDERLQIAENGYKKVCSNYTYEIALKNMISKVGIL